MQLSNHKIFFILLLLIITLAWSLTAVYFFTHLQKIGSGEWAAWHEELHTVNSADSNHFRVVSLWMADGLIQASDMPVHVAYLIIRFVCLVFLLFGFFIFLREWFSDVWSLLGVLVLSALMPITFLPHLQEADVVLYPVFLLGLYFLYKKKFMPLLITVLVGTFAKETIIFLIPLYALWVYSKKTFARTTTEIALLLVVWFAAFFATRNFFYEGTNSSLWQLPHTLEVFGDIAQWNPLANPYLFFIPLFGIFWVLSFVPAQGKPEFFLRARWFIVGFVLFHIFFAWIEETRLLFLLAFLIIPSSLFVVKEHLASMQNENKKIA